MKGALTSPEEDKDKEKEKEKEREKSSLGVGAAPGRAASTISRPTATEDDRLTEISETTETEILKVH